MMKSVRTGQPHDHVPCCFTGCKRERIESEFSQALLFERILFISESERKEVYSSQWSESECG